MKLNDRELATILAALRFWQRVGEHDGEPELEIATDNGRMTQMSDGEIDSLCDRLNMPVEREYAPDKLLGALKCLVEAIDRKYELLNPGRQRDNWLSPRIEGALAHAKTAIAKAEGSAS